MGGCREEGYLQILGIQLVAIYEAKSVTRGKEEGYLKIAVVQLVSTHTTCIKCNSANDTMAYQDSCFMQARLQSALPSTPLTNNKQSCSASAIYPVWVDSSVISDFEEAGLHIHTNKNSSVGRPLTVLSELMGLKSFRFLQKALQDVAHEQYIICNTNTQGVCENAQVDLKQDVQACTFEDFDMYGPSTSHTPNHSRYPSHSQSQRNNRSMS